jgi:endonuclease YncB( thermonuclease family)
LGRVNSDASPNKIKAFASWGGDFQKVDGETVAMRNDMHLSRLIDRDAFPWETTMKLIRVVCAHGFHACSRRDPVTGAGALLRSDFTGKVVGITDGDTLAVMHNGHGEKIRLNGIDYPEKRQAFGSRMEGLSLMCSCQMAGCSMRS